MWSPGHNHRCLDCDFVRNMVQYIRTLPMGLCRVDMIYFIVKKRHNFYVVRQLAYVHGVVPCFKDFHLFDSKFTISFMWYETLFLPTTLLKT